MSGNFLQLSFGGRVTRRVLAAAAILGAVFSSSLSAQGGSGASISRSKGFSIGFSGTGTSVGTQQESTGQKRTQYGYGYQVEGSFGFAKGLSLGVEYASSNIDHSEHGEDYPPFTLTQVGVMGRYFFRDDTKRSRPYAELGVSQRKISEDAPASAGGGEITSSSIGLGLGFGAAFFVTSRLAIDLSGQAGFGTFSKWEVDGNEIPNTSDVKASTLMLRLGARYYIF